MRVGGQRDAPSALLPGKKPGTHCQSSLVWKILPPLGFDPRTVQPIASRYTNWAIPVQTECVIALLICKLCHSACWNLWFHLHIKVFLTLISQAMNNKASVSAFFCQKKGSISIRLTYMSWTLKIWHRCTWRFKSFSVGLCVIGSLVRLLRPWRWKQPTYPKCQ
jgi:hypothetical protein